MGHWTTDAPFPWVNWMVGSDYGRVPPLLVPADPCVSSVSLHSKATRLLDSSEQLVIQLVIVLVGRNVDPVEAGVGFGQVVGVGIDLVDGEESWACSTLEGFEALQGDPGGAGDKLQQPGPALLIVRLHGLPEPLDDVGVGGAVLQPRVGLPVVDVDLTQATHYELQLFLVESLEQVLGDDLVEALL